MRVLLLILLSIFLPPVAVGIVMGWDKHLIINLILLLFGGVPAVIHALWVVLTKDKQAQAEIQG